MCVLVPAGAEKFRAGPVWVAKVTWHIAFLSILSAGLPFFSTYVQVADCVSLYQERPCGTKLGAASRTSVPYGSNAFGQPTQPGSAPIGDVGGRPRLPRPEQVGVTPVGAAVEHGGRDAGAGEARRSRRR